MILPGATLGVLGGGQLGAMFTVAARTMGYQVWVLDPDPQSPAGKLAHQHLCAGYTDADALKRMGASCAAVTTEFENVPAESLRVLAQHTTVQPSANAVEITQDRIREKTFLRDIGLATAPFAPITSDEAIAAEFAKLDGPGLLKVSRFGYDGKGQARITSAAQARQAYGKMGGQPCVLEKMLDLKCEVSVVLARDGGGNVACFPVAENEHRNGILDISIVPARVSSSVAQQAQKMAIKVAEKLDYQGVMAVEFFGLADDTVVVNEIAPRPHNSGHYTLDACVTNQFEQQVRALCSLPLGDTRLLTPAVMVNLIGDSWHSGAPAWDKLLADPRLKLHLYGKQEARAGRKMGHFTCVGETLEQSLGSANAARAVL